MTQYQDYGYTNNKTPHPLDYWWQPLLNQLNNINHKTILDIGCGNGFLANRLIKNNYAVFGTDASEEGIKIANTTNPGRFAVQNLDRDDLPQQFINLSFNQLGAII